LAIRTRPAVAAPHRTDHQHQRHTAARHHLALEVPQAEAPAQPLPRGGAQLQQLLQAAHVAAGLAGLHAITVNFAGHRRVRAAVA
jgi:hypothetical protein